MNVLEDMKNRFGRISGIDNNNEELLFHAIEPKGR
jgi:hypothetical protein